ncbi:DUF3560 domain-containing protein [Xanthomonas campestris pv. campestris]|nr:DUF3560 domain-containing protein [Xanthomonas campestris pv. campestris]
MEGMRATYSPEDNKIRLYPVARLDAETYAMVKGAGFIWAPKQSLFVAPMWTPAREDLALKLCGDIGDEDTTLVERQEERADRFSEYSGKRLHEANRAREAVQQISGNIPMGQPIMIGHHSQAKAQRDQKRIENGMRQAVVLWNTAEYWTRRAAGAIQLAKYKERNDVRARRIKRIEADKRKMERDIAKSTKLAKAWGTSGLTHEMAVRLAGFHDNTTSVKIEAFDFPISLYSVLKDHGWTAEQAAAAAIKGHTRLIAWATRWLNHYTNRLAYENALLQESGGLPADRFDIVPGGLVLIDREWLTVLRVTKREGRILSIRTNARYAPKRSAAEVKDYKAPEAGAAEAVKKATALGPIVNFRTDGCVEMTTAQFKAVNRDFGTIRKVKATDTVGAHRFRSVMQPHNGYRTARVFLTDAKQVALPASTGAAPAPLKREPVVEATAPQVYQPKPKNDFDTMADQLRVGVQVVVAPELFPTPATVAARMAELAGLKNGDTVLEPSAGTGALLDAVKATGHSLRIVAVEKNHDLARRLATAYEDARVIAVDFLTLTPEQLGTFAAVVMNPPFANAIDIEHIKHARTFLQPGGRLVAICAGGPRQADKLRPLVEECGGVWEQLPEGTFAGTNVRTVLLSLTN